MIAGRSRFATTDRSEAESVLTARLAELERAKRLNPTPAQAIPPIADVGILGRFGAFARYTLDVYAAEKRVSARHLVDLGHRVRVFAEFVGEHTRLQDITRRELRDYLVHLVQRGLSEPSQRHYLNAISLIYSRADEHEIVPPHFNPVRLLRNKPQPSAGGAAFLEIHEAALLIDTADKLAAIHGEDFAIARAALACGLLTGGRHWEVMGLLVTDISFESETLSFEPRADRALKNRGSARTIPLWPQLAATLRQFLNRREGLVTAGKAMPSKYLFAVLTGRSFVQDIGKSFARIPTVAGLAGKFDGEAWRVLRRTYATARLQTTDADKPIAEYVVERELGHGSGEMLRRVYGKVGRNRHRAEFVEYRVEQHAGILADAIAARDRRLGNSVEIAAVAGGPIATR